MHNRLLISFSGGETSAYMTNWILNNWRNKYDEIAIVFANTGQENEQTLEFVRDCDVHFNFQTVWIEAQQRHGERKGPSAKVVTFETANRDGAVFEDSIKKYGIPNSKYKDCTRNLKRKPIEYYAREVLKWDDYDIAIGIRVDEIDRISTEQSQRSIVYPLIRDHPTTKPQINAWWNKQPFRLQLKGYQGNCKWCWKKSDRKHFTIISENPAAYDFPLAMEDKHGLVGPEFHHVNRRDPLPDTYRRTFFRGNRSVRDMFEQAKTKSFKPADDDSIVFDETLDIGAGCEESCEVYGPDDTDLFGPLP